MRWMDDIKSATGLSGNGLKEKVVLISERHSQREETDQRLIHGEGNGKTTPLRMMPSISARISGVFQTRRTLFSSTIKTILLLADNNHIDTTYILLFRPGGGAI
jgi:hypothetical protein